MLKKVVGVVVSETEFKENSKILNILTEDGVVGVISKGCKNIKSSLRLISSKLTYAEFNIYYNENKLSTLKDGTIINNFYNIKSDLELISYYVYITELVTQVMKQNCDKEIYDMYIKTVLKIEEGFNPTIMMNILEIKLLDYLGVGIELNSCAKCGKTKDIITIDPDIGGYVCRDCYTNEIIYDEKTQKMLRMYYLVDIESIKDIKISPDVINNINRFLSVYYDRYTGLYIHSKKFLNYNINKLISSN